MQTQFDGNSPILISASRDLGEQLETIWKSSGAENRHIFFRAVGGTSNPRSMSANTSQVLAGKRALAGPELEAFRKQAEKMNGLKAFDQAVEKHTWLVQLCGKVRDLDPAKAKKHVQAEIESAATDDVAAYKKRANDSDLAFPSIAMLLAQLSVTQNEDIFKTASNEMLHELRRTKILNPIQTALPLTKTAIASPILIARVPWLRAYDALISNPLLLQLYLKLIETACWEPSAFESEARRFYVHAGQPLIQFEFRLAR